MSPLRSHIHNIYHRKAGLQASLMVCNIMQIHGFMPVLSHNEFENLIFSLYFFNMDILVNVP